MTVVSYHSSLIRDVDSSTEGAGTTSSQIFLSRGVASSSSEPPSTDFLSSVSVASIFESATKHMLVVGDAACSSVSNEEAVFGQQGQTTVNNMQSPTKNTAASSPAPILHRGSRSPSPFHIETAEIDAKDEGPNVSETSETDKVLDKGKGKEVDRGRRLEREDRFPNPLERTGSRPRARTAAIDVDGRPIQRKSRSNTLFEDPNHPFAVMEDNLLEPLPDLNMCSNMSEVLDGRVGINHPSEVARKLLRAATTTQLNNHSGSAPLPPRALTTAFSDCQPVCPTPNLHKRIGSQAQPDISRLEDLAIRSSSIVIPKIIQPDMASEEVQQHPPSIAAQLPTELIQQILSHLPPSDYDSARRVCRSWYISSLETSLLETMFRRGGWYSSIRRDMGTKIECPHEDTINDEWFMSKRLSRECALGPDWQGNGTNEARNLEKASLPASKKSAFMEASTIDFTEVAIHYPGPNSSGTVFTVSGCGKFVIAANGCLVYLYEMNRNHYSPPYEGISICHPGSLRPITSIICPRRVLACSMDTSSHRNAIAVLLEGRMGLVCDLSAKTMGLTGDKPHVCPTTSFDHGHGRESCRGPSFLDRVSLNSSGSAHASCLGRNGSEPKVPPFVFPGIATTGPLTPRDETICEDVFGRDTSEKATSAGPSTPNTSASRLEPESILPSLYQKKGWYNMPVEAGPRSVYRNICSDDDPPRSVAICPQRRCVAFGCSTGIELHWVDALTGQDLNRWFPLTSPSDYLFFLPPRKSVDSSKKLRLISSSAKPGERSAISERAFGGKLKNSPFWAGRGPIPGVEDITGRESSQRILALLRRREPGLRRLHGNMDNSDHYRAIPLSDGYHILFIDPATNVLCLGSDAPVGGPAKLLRKIWFQGPEGQGSPVAYAAGSDLSWGVRVVAAYGTGQEQTIWLFSVPSDVFTAHNGPQTLVGGSWMRSSSITETSQTEWMKWWPDDGLRDWLDHAGDPIAGILPRSVWPVKIRGQEVGSCLGVVDIAVNSGAAMTIWAFSKKGTARAWKIDNGRNDHSKALLVQRDGTIRETGSDNELETADSSSFPTPEVLEPPLPLAPESFDGSSRSPVSHIDAVRVMRRPHTGWSHHSYDSDGDSIMHQRHGSQDSGNGFSGNSFEAVTFTHQHGPNVYKTTFRSFETFDTIEDNSVDIMPGITRVDLDIR